jgi:DNA-binding GntR family transcriptional regulator
MNEQSLAIAAAVVAVVGLIAALSAHRRMTSTRRSLALLEDGYDRGTLVETLAAYLQELRMLREDLEAVAAKQGELASMLARSARNIGVVRYDAFEDMGGHMSFSAALLDDFGNGVVITAINGRTEARTYAKAIEGGESDFTLSPEESHAITQALNRKTPVRTRVSKGR